MRSPACRFEMGVDAKPESYRFRLIPQKEWNFLKNKDTSESLMKW